MADRSISFSGLMVRALLEDRKGQTRRLGAPRYAVGDRLYVREAWRVSKNYDGHSPVSSKKGQPILVPRSMTVLFEAGGSIANQANGKWEPSDYEPAPADAGWVGKYRQAMHMPRWASRAFLVVTEVRQQHLADISEADSIAEGIEFALETSAGRFYRNYTNPPCPLMAVGSYKSLLDHLHGAGFADGNPLLSAYSFTVHRGNIDAA